MLVLSSCINAEYEQLVELRPFFRPLPLRTPNVPREASISMASPSGENAQPHIHLELATDLMWDNLLFILISGTLSYS